MERNYFRLSVVTAYRPIDVTTKYPGIISIGSNGDHIRFIQSYSNGIRRYYNSNWSKVFVDEIFESKTSLFVLVFKSQTIFLQTENQSQALEKKLIEEFSKITKL